MARESSAQAEPFRLPWHPAFSIHCHAACGETALPSLENHQPCGGFLNFSVSAFQNHSFYPPELRSFVDSANHSSHALNSASSRAS
jgi:hypothetical protein